MGSISGKQKTEARRVKTPLGEIEYILTKKTVKNINIRIKPQGVVCVSAHHRTSKKFVDDVVKEKADFILEGLQKLEGKKKTPAIYEDGDAFMLLGNELIISVCSAPKSRVMASERELMIFVRDAKDVQERSRAVERFVSSQCAYVFEDAVKRIYPMFERYGVNYPTVSVRHMSSRWGSCIPLKQKITLNKRLIHLPMSCIEYVIVHEFCHFIHPNHSGEFYEFMAGFIPDWRTLKSLLKSLGSQV